MRPPKPGDGSIAQKRRGERAPVYRHGVDRVAAPAPCWRPTAPWRPTLVDSGLRRPLLAKSKPKGAETTVRNRNRPITEIWRAVFLPIYPGPGTPPAKHVLLSLNHRGPTPQLTSTPLATHSNGSVVP